MRPLFITFEGLDGSGKSTHLRRCADWLRERGVEVATTHEPGGTDLGRAVREIFLDARHATDGTVELLLVAAARRQHLIEVIDPALAAGRHVLCDRFTDSTRAYQGSGRGVADELIEAVDRVATGGRRPDRTLLFDLPAELARERSNSERRRARSGARNRFDVEELDFYQRVRQGFLDLARADAERFAVVDSSGEREATARRVRQILAGWLGLAA